MKFLFFLFTAFSFSWTLASADAPAPKEKYDTKLPVEISSDTLEVLQHENKAIFRGNVVAVQGKIRLKSDVMIVHYKQQGDAKTAPPAPPKPAAPAASGKGADAAMGAITLIEVEGNVLIATPEETAKGDRGDYHVDQKVIHLFGDNVTLTRDKNILKGTALDYNLETGRSVLTGGASVNTSPDSGRVRGVFVPSQEEKKP